LYNTLRSFRVHFSLCDTFLVYLATWRGVLALVPCVSLLGAGLLRTCNGRWKTRALERLAADSATSLGVYTHNIGGRKGREGEAVKLKLGGVWAVGGAEHGLTGSNPPPWDFLYQGWSGQQSL